MKDNILSLNHVSIIVSNTQRSLSFYRDMLGLEVDASRPDLGYSGAWLFIGTQQIHLLEVPNPDPTEDRPAHGGRDRHIAVNIKSIDLLQQVLEKQGINYSRSKSGRKALFFRDPDGNTIEAIES